MSASWALHNLNRFPLMQRTVMLVSFSVLRGSCIRCGGILLSDGEEEEKAPFSYHDPDIAFERCVSGSASNSFGTLTLQ